MRQALHILGKDARYLRKEIAMFLCLAVLFAWAETHLPIAFVMEALLSLGMIHLVARVIHAESLVDDRQFWLTRPYRRRSLVTAKLLFIAIFLITPMAIARLFVLQQQGYPVVPSLPPLIWWMLLIFIAAAIPIATIAALTSGGVQFSLSLFVLALFAALCFLVGPIVLRNSFDIHGPSWPPGLMWMQITIVATFLALPLLPAFWRQYRSRSTATNRRLAICTGLFALALYYLVPVPSALAMQAWFSRAPEPPIRLSLGKSPRGIGMPDKYQANWRIPLNLTVEGLPAGVDLQADYLRVNIEWPGGESFAATSNPSAGAVPGGKTAVNAQVTMPSAMFHRNWAKAATIRGTVYLTSLGDAESRTLKVNGNPVNLQDGLRCSAGEFKTYICRAYFGWPSRLVLSRDAGGESAFSRTVSYSPIPAGFGLDSQESRYTSLEPDAKEVTIITKRPLAHFRRDFEAANVRLGDLITRDTK